MLFARQIGLAVLVAAAFAVFFLLAPSEATDVSGFDPSSRTYSSLISDALDSAEANEALADSAPQQQVVNGWVARDLLTIVAFQNTDLLDALGALGDQNVASSALAVRDDRPAALLVIAVLAIALWGITAGPSRPAPPALDGETLQESTKRGGLRYYSTGEDT